MDYINQIRGKLERYFDIFDNFELDDRVFDFYARFNQRNAKYVLTKSAEVYAFTNNEYVFYKNIPSNFNDSIFNEIYGFLNRNINEIVSIDDDHMSSSISLIFETNRELDKEIIESIKKFKFYKSFKFGFKGWVNCKLIVIDNSSNQVYCNKIAVKSLKQFLS